MRYQIVLQYVLLSVFLLMQAKTPIPNFRNNTLNTKASISLAEELNKISDFDLKFVSLKSMEGAIDSKY